MKMNQSINKTLAPFLGLILLTGVGCKRNITDLQSPTYPVMSEVFIDGFSSDLGYAAFGGSDVKAFQVDSATTYGGTKASMRYEVPDANSPKGAYAGGTYFSKTGRDLSGYDALTFYVKATQPATIGVIGFGNDLGANKYQVAINGLSVNSNWKKVIIPIPDAAKLKAERGMFFYSAGPESGKGYTFWIDEVRFEKLGTLAHGQASILNGDNKTETSFIGVSKTIDGIKSTYNMPDGVNQDVAVSTAYFTFTSSNPATATVNEVGKVSTIGTGSTVITATLGGKAANGSLTINSGGLFQHAPTPTRNASDVISIYSETYPNVPVDYYNGYWAPFQKTLSADFTVEGDNVLNYTNFNFVGVQFSSPTINASGMTHLHLDLYFPNAIAAGTNLKITVNDFGADGAFGGTDDKGGSKQYTSPVLVSQNWVSLDIPLASLSGLTTKAHLGQIVFDGGTSIPNFYADNIYLYNDGSIIPVVPASAAPTPTVAAADVTSIFSDAYTNVSGSDLNPGWGQATVTSQVSIAGNNTLKYAGLNFQGLQIGSSQNVTSKGFLHLDYYSANSTSLKVYLISSGPIEKGYALTVPSSGGVNGWKSIEK